MYTGWFHEPSLSIMIFYQPSLWSITLFVYRTILPAVHKSLQLIYGSLYWWQQQFFFQSVYKTSNLLG